MLTGDSQGIVRTWALGGILQDLVCGCDDGDIAAGAVASVAQWRAAQGGIGSFARVANRLDLFLTCGADSNVQLYTVKGAHVGTFGQVHINSSTSGSISWCHKMTPYSKPRIRTMTRPSMQNYWALLDPSTWVSEEPLQLNKDDERMLYASRAPSNKGFFQPRATALTSMVAGTAAAAAAVAATVLGADVEQQLLDIEAWKSVEAFLGVPF